MNSFDEALERMVRVSTNLGSDVEQRVTAEDSVLYEFSILSSAAKEGAFAHVLGMLSNMLFIECRRKKGVTNDGF